MRAEKSYCQISRTEGWKHISNMMLKKLEIFSKSVKGLFSNDSLKILVFNEIYGEIKKKNYHTFGT